MPHVPLDKQTGRKRPQSDADRARAKRQAEKNAYKRRNG